MVENGSESAWLCALQDDIMATRPAQQALVPGRGVLLCDAASGLTELGAILGEPTASAGALP